MKHFGIRITDRTQHLSGSQALKVLPLPEAGSLPSPWSLEAQGGGDAWPVAWARTELQAGTE